MASSRLLGLWNHPAGPKTNFSKPPEMIAYPHQMVVACSGMIWSRYSLVIIPRNVNLFCVNIAMACTGIYQISRKVRQDYLTDGAKEEQEHANE